MFESDRSGTTKSDDHFGAVDNNRHVPAPTRVSKHFIHLVGSGRDLFVVDIKTTVGVILTGRQRVGSGVLAEDDYLLSH